MGPILRVVWKSGAGRRLPRVILTGVLLLGAAANGAAQPVQKQVLVLQSIDRGNIVVDHFTTNFHIELDHRAEQPVNFVQVFALFTPFVTTKARGLGIGLTIARSIVDAHGGTIAARNDPDGGASFTVTLRRSEGAAFVTDALH